MKIYKQWQLPPGATVEFSDGSRAKFLRMDGTWAKWEQDGQLKTGNFNGFTRYDQIYKPISE